MVEILLSTVIYSTDISFNSL